jgi:tetratricopeptide (TPR) repeat protein
MSRSIHSTWSKLTLERRYDFSDNDVKKLRIKQMRDELETKSMLKKRKYFSRKQGNSLINTNEPVKPESVVIKVEDSGEYIHYPASRDDLIEILKRLPTNVTAGIHSITFCLGKEYQDENWGGVGGKDIDPFTGRICIDKNRHVYTPPVLGVYQSDNCKIYIYAYVYDKKLINLDVIEVFYRLKMLSTVVHEIAHHDDNMRRSGQGRWFLKNESRCENYAEVQQKNWVKTVVIPYLLEQYPTEYDRLLNWIKVNGGIDLKLTDFVDEPKTQKKGGMVSFGYNITYAIEEMINNVCTGKPSQAVMYEFAYDFHIGDHYDECMKCLETILSINPKDFEALGLKADTLIHFEKYDEAEIIAHECLVIDPSNLGALDVLCEVYMERKEWETLVKTSFSGIRASINDWKYRYFLEYHLIASLFLGDFLTAEKDAEALPDKKGGIGQKKRALIALVALLSGDLEKAVVTAEEVLAQDRQYAPAKTIAKAVIDKAWGDSRENILNILFCEG